VSAPLAVLLVLALLFGLLWLARRKGLAVFAMRWGGAGVDRPTPRMHVLERVPLSGQHSLHLVACAGRLLVVAVSPSGCSTLADYAEPSADARSAAGGLR